MHLDYTSKHYMNNDQLLVRDNLPFRAMQEFDPSMVILLGTLFMKNYYIEFDITHQRMGWLNLANIPLK